MQAFSNTLQGKPHAVPGLDHGLHHGRAVGVLVHLQLELQARPRLKPEKTTHKTSRVRTPYKLQQSVDCCLNRLSLWGDRLGRRAVDNVRKHLI
jgi:hypothetical protein